MAEHHSTPLCGIYAIAHRKTGMQYIGASRDIRKRWWHHKHELRRGIHACERLQAAWTADGATAFTFTILECCEPHQLPERETHYQHPAALLYNTRHTRAYPPVLTGEAFAKTVEQWRPKRTTPYTL